MQDEGSRETRGVVAISTEERVARIVIDLDAAAENFEIFAFLSDVFYRLRCHGDAELTEEQRDELLNAFARLRPTLQRKVPVFSLERISDGFDAAAEHLVGCTGAEMFDQPGFLADRRARMRLAELEAFTMHLGMELLFAEPTGRPRRLKRIVENEAEAVRLMAEIADRRRPRKLAA